MNKDLLSAAAIIAAIAYAATVLIDILRGVERGNTHKDSRFIIQSDGPIPQRLIDAVADASDMLTDEAKSTPSVCSDDLIVCGCSCRVCTLAKIDIMKGRLHRAREREEYEQCAAMESLIEHFEDQL